MAELRDVIDTLNANNEDTVAMKEELHALNILLSKRFLGKNLDDLEDKRESKQKAKASAPALAPTQNKSVASGNTMNFGGLGGMLAGGGIGLGAVGVGLGAFFTGLAGADAIMNKFGSGDNLKKLMINLADGLKAFGDRELLAVGALLAGSALFVAMPGLGGGDIVVGLGAIGLGIGGFFAGLAAGDAGMKYLDADGNKIKNMMKNVAEGLKAFGDRELLVLGGLLAGSALFAAVGGLKVAGVAAVGLTAIGLGIGGFFAGLAASDKAMSYMDTDGTKLKNMMKNVAEGLSALSNRDFLALGTAMAAGGALAALFPPTLAGKAVVGLAAIGAGIGGFFAAIAGIGDLAGFIGVDGSGFKTLMTNVGGGLKQLNDIDDGLLTKVGALAGLGPAIISMLAGNLAFSAVEGTIKTAKKLWSFLTGQDLQGDGTTSTQNTFQAIVDSLAPLKDLDTSQITNLDKMGEAIKRFTDSLQGLADVKIDASASKLGDFALLASNSGALLKAMANGGEFELQIPRKLDKTYKFPEGGIMKIDVPLDQLQERMSQIRQILTDAAMVPQNMSSSAVVPRALPPVPNGANTGGSIVDASTTVGAVNQSEQVFPGGSMNPADMSWHASRRLLTSA